MLDTQGYVYKAEGGVLKITKGFVMVMKGNLEVGMYRLQGSVLFGGI